jgi:hypothetical protein
MVRFTLFQVSLMCRLGVTLVVAVLRVFLGLPVNATHIEIYLPAGDE